MEEKKDYSKTLNLPKTDFEMRGNLPKKEPEILEKFIENKIYEKALKQNEILVKLLYYMMDHRMQMVIYIQDMH